MKENCSTINAGDLKLDSDLLSNNIMKYISDQLLYVMRKSYRDL